MALSHPVDVRRCVVNMSHEILSFCPDSDCGFVSSSACTSDPAKIYPLLSDIFIFVEGSNSIFESKEKGEGGVLLLMHMWHDWGLSSVTVAFCGLKMVLWLKLGRIQSLTCEAKINLWADLECYTWAVRRGGDDLRLVANLLSCWWQNGRWEKFL